MGMEYIEDLGQLKKWKMVKMELVISHNHSKIIRIWQDKDTP
jgi:hypothetical protein